MSTTDDSEGEVTRPESRAGAERTRTDDFPVTGLIVERERGRAAGETQPGHILPLGTRLRDFEITGLVGEGGFGIVYLAWDHSLQRRVAVKEYMPSSMVARVGGSSAIIVKSERHVDTFKAGLKSFVNEARLLARFDHPSLVKVYRFWEENGTAYMVMPYYEGPTLKTALAGLGHVPDENEIRAWLKPILNALALMHAAQCYHRDIAPDNILLTPRGPLLLDFGAARRVIGDMTHAMTVVLKPGFAPIEQYGDVTSMAQGPWTDLYALGCVVYFAITGKTPTSSVERLMDDRLEPLSRTAAGHYSPGFLRAIDAALAVRPADRPQDHRQFRALLDADRPPSFAETTASVPLEEGPPSLWPDLTGSRPDRSTRPASLSPSPPLSSPPSSPPSPPEPPTQVMARAAAPLGPAAPLDAMPAPARRLARERSRRAPLRGVGLGLALIAASALVWWFVREITPRPGGRAGLSTAASAAAPAASEPTSPSTSPSTTPSTTPPSPSTSTANPAAGTAATPPMPIASDPFAAEIAVPKPRAEAARPLRARNEAPPVVAAPVPPRTPAVSAKCSDILQKASLEPLTADESAYLKRECR